MSPPRVPVFSSAAERAEQLARAFYRDLRDRDGHTPEGPVRMLEKTPKNALRIPFFDAIWRDATFVYLYRDVREALASMMEAWACGAFRTYPELPGWTGHPWSLLLIPGWQELISQPLWVVVAHQWATTTTILLDDLERLPRERVRTITHEDFLNAPQAAIDRFDPPGCAEDQRRKAHTEAWGSRSPTK